MLYRVYLCVHRGCGLCGSALHVLDRRQLCWECLYITKQEDIFQLNEANHHHGNSALCFPPDAMFM